MFEGTDIEQELSKLRSSMRSHEDQLIIEAKRILKKDLFAESKILENLRQYNKSYEVIDEEDVDAGLVFTPAEIKKIAVLYRLKFLESKIYKPEIPYEAVLKIKYLNDTYYKEIKLFKMLALPEAFKNKASTATSVLFVKTNYDNYYLVHRWGGKLKLERKL